MENPNDKLNLDDITFDDFIGEGVDVTPAEQESKEEPKAELEDIQASDNFLEKEVEGDSDIEDKELDEDVKDKKEEEEVPVGEDQDTFADASEESTVVGEVLAKLGYEFEEKFEDTPEGLTKMTQAVSDKMSEDKMSEMFESFPLIKQHLEYVLSGGDSQQFMTAYAPTQDYGKLVLNEKDVSMQKAVLVEYFRKKGHEDSFISDILNDYNDGEKLYGKAKQAKEALTKLQNTERTNMLEDQKKVQADQMKEQKDMWDEVYNKVDTAETLAGLDVPSKEKKKFFKYISSPVTKEGHTQRDIDHMNADMDVKLAMDWMMYNGFDLSKIIDKKAKTKSVQSLRSRITKHEDKVKSTRNKKSNSRSFDIDSLDLSL
jgi:hypothetical protein|tara:strand:+ start:1238 stop:2356 length:1119 start_codon:yes stop_codon:yes gene_type:complete